jgi:hypothetical protein
MTVNNASVTSVGAPSGMDHVIPSSEITPAATRMRQCRARWGKGKRVVPVEVSSQTTEALILLGLLDPASRADAKAVGAALSSLVEPIPVEWWKLALVMRARPGRG